MFAEIHRELYDALPFVLCTLGESTRQGAIDRPEGFEFHQFIWIVEGEGNFSAGGQRFFLGKDEGMFFRRNVPHRYESSAGMHTAWCTFRGAEGVLDYYHAPDFFQFRTPAALGPATASLAEACESNSSIISRSAAGYGWLTEVMEALFAISASPSVQIRQFLENHYSEPLTLDEIAQQVRMDRFALCHYYGKEHGITVMEQLKKIRVAKAKQFLRYSSKSVEEIGRLCGFESPSYFGKRFREEAGCSPREYRTMHNR